jgi:hypothetical protein
VISSGLGRQKSRSHSARNARSGKTTERVREAEANDVQRAGSMFVAGIPQRAMKNYEAG